jgi:hypothetical protein
MFKVELRTCQYQFWIYEDNELQWEHQLERILSVLHQDDHEILSDKKSSQWKFWIAYVPKSNTAATNVRIADNLNMGAPQSVSMQPNRFRQHNQDRDASYLALIQNITK